MGCEVPEPHPMRKRSGTNKRAHVKTRATVERFIRKWKFCGISILPKQRLIFFLSIEIIPPLSEKLQLFITASLVPPPKMDILCCNKSALMAKYGVEQKESRGKK
jgi:hypothetical protein